MSAYDCPICVETMKDPVTLACGHSACIGCLRDQLRIQGTGGVCAFCRHPITQPFQDNLSVNISLRDAIKDLSNRGSGASSPPNPYRDIVPESAGAILYEKVEAKDVAGVREVCEHFRGNSTVLDYHHGQHRWTPMHRACQDNSIDIVTCLLDAGARVDSKNKYGRTPLHFIAWPSTEPGHPGHAELAGLLVRRGANIQHTDDAAWSPLHRAVHENRRGVVSCLLNHGAQVDAKNAAGRTSLHFAALKGHTAFVKLLLGRGGDIQAEDNSGWSPLHWAVQENKGPVVKLLVQRGASLTAASNDGKMPYDLATSEDLKSLLCSKADAGAALYGRVEENDLVGVSSICDRFRGDPSVLDHRNSSAHDYAPLHKAVMDNKAAIVVCLLDAGAHVDVKERGGWTPLYHAAHGSLVDMTRLPAA